ncbi:MAG: ABC transporter ATP-binding protein [Desulfobacterales bacterium]|nr:ABC transporter ATP-binding protein [Desulfobacterales bacterium]
MTLLTADGIGKNFGGVRALRDVSLTVEKGEIIGMIGPNGSGKTTFINNLSGIYTPSTGHFVFNGEDITGLPAHTIMDKGISRTFQNLRVFPNISVLENVLIGLHCLIDVALWDIYFRIFKTRKMEEQAREKALSILKIAELDDKAHELAKNLPYGKQRLLEICRAIASEPHLLLLDEPCAGMNPIEMDELADFIRLLQGRGITVFVIEHNMRFIMSVAQRLIVLENGAKFTEGNPTEIQNDKRVQAIYLGDEEELTCYA